MSKESRSIEVRARSVDEAVLKALEQLRLNRDQVEVEVIKEGGRSLLGLLREDAVVKVVAKGPRMRQKRAPIKAVAKAPWMRQKKDPIKVTAKARRMPEQEASVPPSADELDEIARLGMETLQDLIGHMGIHARVTRESVLLKSQTSATSVLLNMSGQDLGLLIGRRGETLRDLQFLTCLIVSRRIQRWPNVVVDVEHYRARREKTLADLARRIADRVCETGEPMPLEPMPPNERRIVHLALRDAPDVFTESTGQADERRVVIIPKE